jgi:hypothetical protein
LRGFVGLPQKTPQAQKRMKVLSKLSFQGLLVLVSQEDPLDKGRFLKVPAVLDATTFLGAEGQFGSF